MQLTGLKYGSQLLNLVEFPVAKTLTDAATRDEIQQMLDQYGKIVVKPVFYGGIGKKGKAGLVRIVDTSSTPWKPSASSTSPVIQ